MNLRRKIILCNVITIIIALLGASLLVISNMSDVRDTVMESGNQLGQKTEEVSSDMLVNEIRDHLEDSVKQHATIFDDELKEFGQDVEVLAGCATNIYSNQSDYGNVYVPDPKKENEGELAIQFLRSESVDMNNPAIVREKGLLGNLAAVATQTNEGNENIVSSYVASKNGLMIQADYISAEKFDEEGNLLFYEAAERPWYKGAFENMGKYYTPVTADAHGTGTGIMCGVPFFENGEFAGVAGSGMYLYKMEDTINSLVVGENGFACAINDQGSVIFSSLEKGELAVSGIENIDMRKGNNKELATFIEKALNGEHVFEKVKIDGTTHYITAAIMPTVNWAFIMALPESEFSAPINNLMQNIEDNTALSVSRSNSAINNTMKSILIFGIILFIICAGMSAGVGSTIVKPIRLLTENVNKLSGDNLDFKWELETKDETTVLGKAFEDLTVKMKEYIENLTYVTAEKERIGTELNVATKIQKDMLPRSFPAFPEIPEIELFASMDPAKEVGGDFYDFFKIDNNHVALVIADVSGKGVPAALFMVISKTLVKNQTLLGKQKPSQILSEVNNQLCEGNEANLFCTCWLGIINIETGHMVCASAGHEYPAIKHPNSKFEMFKDPHGLALAAMEGVPYKDYEIDLEPGSTLFVYTDGVAEATNSQYKLFEVNRMIDALNIDPDGKPETLLKNVRNAVDSFVGEAPQFDDITMLALYYKGKNNDAK